MNLKEEIKKLREAEMSHPIEYFINDALQVCKYAKEDGFLLEDIIIELKNYNNNTEKLHLVYDKYYDENNRIYEQYKSIAGYMQNIGHDIYMIDKKLEEIDMALEDYICNNLQHIKTEKNRLL